MSDISNPAKAGRGDRKNAQKLIDAAYASGRLTAADRALRTERVSSAHTRGDLAVLVRDLNRAETTTAATTAAAAGPAAAAPSSPPTPPAAPTPPSLGSAIPPEELKAMSTGGAARTINLGETMTSALSVGGAKNVRRFVLIFVLVFVGVCGLGIFGIVGAVVNGVRHGVSDIGSDSSPATASLNLQTAKGWSALVAAVKDETGTTRVYDAVVYHDYASVNSVADEGAKRLFYRQGAIQKNFSSPITPAPGDKIDLSDIDPDLIASLPAKSAKEQHMPDFESAYMIVNIQGDQPGIMVYLQQTGKLSRWTIFDLDGKVIGGTPG